MYTCLCVTCHLLFWQNERGLLRATAVSRGWERTPNKIQHSKLTLEKKKVSRRSFRDPNSQPFDYEAGALTDKLSRIPSRNDSVKKVLVDTETVLTLAALSEGHNRVVFPLAWVSRLAELGTGHCHHCL